MAIAGGYRFKVGDVVRCKHDMNIETVIGVPGQPAYDRKGYCGAEDGFVGSSGLWYWQEHYILVSNSGKGTVMSKIKDMFKSKKQKLFEKYVFNGEGINWSSEVLQEVLMKTLEKDLVELCETKEKEEAKEK